MVEAVQTIEACPKCKSSEYVRHKLALIDKGYPEDAGYKWRPWLADQGSPSVGDLKPEYWGADSATQFIHALYCERCGIGFIPEHMAKSDTMPRFRPVSGGFRRIYPDGTLGPLLVRMADDPDLQYVNQEPPPEPA